MGMDLKKEIILDIKKIGSKYKLDRIILFGSRARGDNKKNSDIDLAIFTNSDFKNYGSLASDIDDINTLLKIDVVFMNENTSLELIEDIKKDGVIIYE